MKFKNKDKNKWKLIGYKHKRSSHKHPTECLSTCCQRNLTLYQLPVGAHKVLRLFYCISDKLWRHIQRNSIFMNNTANNIEKKLDTHNSKFSWKWLNWNEKVLYSLYQHLELKKDKQCKIYTCSFANLWFSLSIFIYQRQLATYTGQEMY